MDNQHCKRQPSTLEKLEVDCPLRLDPERNETSALDNRVSNYSIQLLLPVRHVSPIQTTLMFDDPRLQRKAQQTGLIIHFELLHRIVLMAANREGTDSELLTNRVVVSPLSNRPNNLEFAIREHLVVGLRIFPHTSQYLLRIGRVVDVPSRDFIDCLKKSFQAHLLLVHEAKNSTVIDNTHRVIITLAGQG